MAELKKKINELPVKAIPIGADLIPIWDSETNTTKYVTAESLPSTIVGAVASVNGETGVVVLEASDLDAETVNILWT